MTNAEIEKRFKAAIDQYYNFPNEKYVRDNQLQFIGGLLQAALHILPFDDYYALKVYCWEQHGYDPGGVTTGQIRLDEIVG